MEHKDEAIFRKYTDLSIAFYVALEHVKRWLLRGVFPIEPQPR